MAIATVNALPANGHTRRVTLNLIRNSSVCPDALRAVLQRLLKSGWDWQGVSKQDLETIYGHVDANLCSIVKAEYEVDTSTMRDHAYPYDHHRNLHYLVVLHYLMPHLYHHQGYLL